jgi:hypothetical protein
MTTDTEELVNLLTFIFKSRKVIFLPTLGRIFKDVHIKDGDLVFVTMDNQGRVYTPDIVRDYIKKDLQTLYNNVENEINAAKQRTLINNMQDEKEAIKTTRSNAVQN